MPAAKFYTLYEKGSDDIVAIGTSRECATQMKLKVNSFLQILSRVRRGICKKYELYEEALKEQEEEDY